MSKRFNELKETLLETQRPIVNDMFVKHNVGAFELDEQAEAELQQMISQHDLASEIFQNTIALIVDDKQQIEYLELCLQQFEIEKRKHEILSKEEYETKISDIINNFILHYFEELEMIRANSMLRAMEKLEEELKK